MYQAPQKRRQAVKLTILYTFMTLFVAITVTMLVFFMLGYRFNKTSNTIIQGGLVQFETKPGGAKVTIGTAKLAGRTPSKITVNPGSYKVSMERANYRPWQKTVDVDAGHVLYLKYAKLVPNTVERKTLADIANVSQMVVTPSGQYMTILADSARPTLTMIDLKDSKQKQTSLQLPIEVAKNTKPIYKIEKWSGDSKKFLLSEKLAKTTRWFLVDRNHPEDTVNISDTYDLAVSSVLFDPRDTSQLIVRTTDGAVRSLDANNKSLSPIIIEKTTDLSLFGSTLMYVRTIENGRQSVGYLSLGKTELRELKQLASKTAVHVAADEYYGTTFIAITNGESLEVNSIDNLPSSSGTGPLSFKTLVTQATPGTTNYLSVQTGGRFVIAQSDDALSVYDLELKKYSTTKFTAEHSEKVRWIDGYHFYSAIGGDLTMMDFDGTNQQVITKTLVDMDVAQLDNGKYWYTLDKTKSGYELIRLTMLL